MENLSAASSQPKQNIIVQGDMTFCQHEGFWFAPQSLKAIDAIRNNFKPLPSDVILASYPKTGTTWLKSLLFSIVHRSTSKQSLLTENHPHELVPFLELRQDLCSSPPNITPPETTTTSPPPSCRRILSTHIPHQLLAETFDSSDCRVVYVTRNPKDTIVSMWNFFKHPISGKPDPWSLEKYVEMFCKGVVPYGPYYDHVLGYRNESLKRPNKIFFITYEELKNDAKNHVKSLAEFLGCPIEKEEELEEIVKSCSIETLTGHQVNKSSESPTGFPFYAPYSSFFRKGEIGDYKNYMSKEMIDLVDATTLEKFHGFSYDELTKPGDLILWEYKGTWFYPPRIPLVQNVVRNYKPLPSDVILASFPKTGTTCLKNLLFATIHGPRSSSSNHPSLTENHPQKLIPSLELQVSDEKEAHHLYSSAPENYPKTTSSPLSSRRIFSTHIPYQFLEKTFDSSDCRVVYVTREPKDTIVSFWHSLQKQKKDRVSGTLEEFVGKFCKGVVPFGPYYDHVLGYKKKSLERPNKVFFLTYEDLVNDTNSIVKRLAEFLGCPINKEEELEEIVNHNIEMLTSHQVNKSSEPTSPLAVPHFSFFTKGEVGDYKNYMSKETIDLVDETTLEKFGGLSYDALVSTAAKGAAAVGKQANCSAP